MVITLSDSQQTILSLCLITVTIFFEGFCEATTLTYHHQSRSFVHSFILWVTTMCQTLY